MTQRSVLLYYKETILPSVPEQFLEQMVNFRELMLIYNSAIKEIITKLEILNDELSLHNRNKRLY